MYKIELKNKIGKGKYILIDDEDFDHISKINWYLNGITGQVWGQQKIKNKWRYFWLSRFILNAPKGLEVDHINHNKLDNRKNNLRLCSTIENHRNTLKHITNQSGYKGVSWHKQAQKWESRIRVFGKKLHLGLFKTKREAAIAYDKIAKQHFGNFALLNFQS